MMSMMSDVVLEMMQLLFSSNEVARTSIGPPEKEL